MHNRLLPAVRCAPATWLVWGASASGVFAALANTGSAKSPLRAGSGRRASRADERAYTARRSAQPMNQSSDRRTRMNWARCSQPYPLYRTPASIELSPSNERERPTVSAGPFVQSWPLSLRLSTNARSDVQVCSACGQTCLRRTQFQHPP